MQFRRVLVRVFLVAVLYAIPSFVFVLPFVTPTLVYSALGIVLMLSVLFPWVWFRSYQRSVWKSAAFMATTLSLLLGSLLLPYAWIFIEEGYIPPGRAKGSQAFLFLILAVAFGSFAAVITSRLKRKALL